MKTLIKEEETYFHSHPGNIRWGAILGGWVVATAAALVFYAIGTALGINVIQATDLDALSKKTVVLTGIWLLISWVSALYLGGLFASRGIREANPKTGALHAIGVWAVSNVLTIMIGVSGLGITGMAGIMAAGQAGKGLVAAAPFAAKAASENPNVPADLLAKLKYGISDSVAKRSNKNAGNAQQVENGTVQVRTETVNNSVNELSNESLLAVGADFLRGDKEAAKNSLAINTSLSRQEAEQLVDSLSAQTEEVKARLKEAADKAALYTSAMLWVSVLISLLSLQAAIMGGRAGAASCCEEHRTVVYREPVTKF